MGSKAANVLPVISLGNSSKVYPTASFAATFAMGKPVAFDANADDRLTRGFISIIIIRPFSGLTANCTLDPPVSTPMVRKHKIAQLRIFWNSLSVSVMAGATVMESPVCTPMGSIFSIEQIIMVLSAVSRITSNSNSFHPNSDSSTNTSVIGLAFNPFSINSWNSS